MQLKRFHSSTVLEALALARREMGADALVLSTRLVPVSGWRGLAGARQVEVTAALDRKVSKARPPASVTRHRDASPGDQTGLVARLCASGLDRELALEVAASLPTTQRRAASMTAIKHALASRLEHLAIGDEPQARAEVFIGPPGAGKTTTIAKIATQARARRHVRLSLISADGYRVGAMEQLRLFADIIGTSFASAHTIVELEQAIARARHPVLIDTAGRSPGDAPQQELLATLADRADVRTHLVMAAGTRGGDVERIFNRYRAGKPDRVVLTKLDETDALSDVVRVLRDRRIPVSYLGTGQQVPEDLRRPTPLLLAASMLGEPPEALGVPA